MMPPSTNRVRRTNRCDCPVASSVPTSRERSSTPRRNSSATKMAAEAIRNRLNPMNKPEKSVAPADASRPSCFTGWKERPKAAGSRRWFSA